MDMDVDDKKNPASQFKQNQDLLVPDKINQNQIRRKSFNGVKLQSLDPSLIKNVLGVDQD